MVAYLPFDKRTPDSQYRDMVSRIVDHGIRSQTRQGPQALTIIGVQNHYDLRNGFPLIPDRSIKSFWRKGIGELCAFINGVRTLDGLAEFGVDWWGQWGTEEKCAKRGLETGDLGPGIYGGAFHDFPTAEGPPMNQFKHLVEQIREFPTDRTHFVTPWIPQYQTRGEGKTPKTTIAPCHGWVHVRVFGEAEEELKLHLHMFQRSGDVPVGVPSNMVQYAALALMLEQLTGYEAVEFVHTISDAHVYADQLDKIALLRDREPMPLPTVFLNAEGKKVTDIHDFRGEHFDVEDYIPHPSIPGIPVST
ncbi:MAG: thymidylate synthase [Candidatus Saccharibacteria bacterium]